jgi:hypothetical protein
LLSNGTQTADEAVEPVVHPVKRHGVNSVIVVVFGNIAAPHPHGVITHQAPAKFHPALEAAEERQSQQPGNVAAILRIAERLARMSRYVASIIYYHLLFFTFLTDCRPQLDRMPAYIKHTRQIEIGIIQIEIGIIPRT